MKYVSFLVFFILLLPGVSLAQILITEVMYDLEGSDTGREWIEVTNLGSENIDVSTWKFFENETNHGLVLFQGDGNLSPNSSAIIVTNPSKFLSDWPSFGGTIYDSSFSFKNTGEFISIRDPDLVDIDSVTYDPLWGGEGDGNSLQKIEDTWTGLTPTPGQYSEVSNTSENETSEPQPPTSGGGVSGTNFPVGSISTKILGEKVLLSGADTFFKAESVGVKGEKLENARHLWNFGDGSIKEGENVLYNYIYPGEYVVFLDVSSESFTANDKLYVKVVPSSLLISESNKDFIKISNSSGREINVSLWIIQAGYDFFNIPKNTYIKKNGEITFSYEVTNLNGSIKPVMLLYPNGKTAYEFNESAIVTNLETRFSNEKSGDVKETKEVREVGLPSIGVENSKKNTATAINSITNVEGDGIEVFNDEEGSFAKWFIILLGIIILSALAVVFLRRDNTVEGFTIIE